MFRQRAEQADVAVVGAGIIGLATALALQLAGRSVLVLDPQAPAEGCSRGNAGIIATSEIFPLAGADHILRAPRLLLDPLGPLAIRPADLARLAPWLVRFLVSALPARRERATRALAAISAPALAAHRRLLSEAAAASLLIERGMLTVVREARAASALRKLVDACNSHAVQAHYLSGHEVGELEPALAGRACAGIFHPGVAHVTDPHDVAKAFARRIADGGGRFERAQVLGIVPGIEQVIVQTAKGEFRATQVVVAAGLWSAPLIAPFGLRAPIAAERGYHLMVDRPADCPSRPVMFHQESFVATPLAAGLRLAGTVELADDAARPDWRRADVLLTLARRYLPELDGGGTRWMGCRPTLPDSLPAIGRVPSAPRVLYAFGHQHLGLTLAGITAQCIAALAGGGPPPIDLAPFSVERFGRAGNRRLRPGASA